MNKVSTSHTMPAALAAALLVPLFWSGGQGAVGHAATTGSRHAVRTAATQEQGGPVERGTIVGWRGGNAVIYPTVGFFGTSQIVAVGAVQPDGSFTVRFPAALPVDMLQTSSAQCATIRSSEPAALTNSTGNYLIFQHGQQIGATHAGSSPAIAAFTGAANGDSRTGFLYADRDTIQSGFCHRTLRLGGITIDFRQNLDLHLHKGWNAVVANFSIPHAGHIVSDLRVSANCAGQQWFFFRPPLQP